MLAPIPPKRKDGKTSFACLTKYLLKKLDPGTGEVIDRGDVLISDNLLSEETASDEMRAVAAENFRCKDPVYHYLLAWQEGESPTQEQWKKAVKKTLDNLGFNEHQYMAVSHKDTDAFHVHIVVNRVHPERYRAHYPKYSKLTLDKSIREIEAAQGWNESRGLYYWDQERKQAVKTSRETLQKWRNEREIKTPTGKAAKFEVYTDNESLETYCMGKPAKDIKALFKTSSPTWDDLHAVLKKNGLLIHAGDRGGYTVSAVNSPIHVKASKVFRDNFAGKKNREILEQKVGAYRAPSGLMRVIEEKEHYKSSREPLKRDPNKRAFKREERAKARQNLKQTYIAYKQICFDEMNRHTANFKTQYQHLDAKYKEKRVLLRRTIQQPELRKAAMSILAMQAVQEKEVLRKKLATERTDKRPQSYRDWITGKAIEGNEAAISQLRGFLYAEKKKNKHISQEATDTIQASVESGRIDPTIFTVPGIQWEVNARTGDVAYKMDGGTAFTDHGEKISVASTSGGSQLDTIGIAMKLAHEKYRREIILTGSELFKKRCVEAAIKGRLNMTFSDPQLNDLKRQLERQRGQQRTMASRKGQER